MVEVAIAVVAAAVLLGLIAWHESRGPSEWEDLLSPDARDAFDFLRKKFDAEERAVAWGCSTAAAAGAEFLVGLVPDRLQVLKRLELYARIIAAAAPAPHRLQVRMSALKSGFEALSGQANVERLDRAQRDLKDLDRETLESCRVLARAVSVFGVERKESL